MTHVSNEQPGGTSAMEKKDTGAPRRAALGRGLAALIPGATPATPTPAGLRSLPIERVQPNRTQPRKHFEPEALADLIASVKTRGVLQPIIVRRLGDNYEI